MTLPTETSTSLLTALALVVALFDLRYRRIPNIIVFPAMAVGLVLGFVTPAPPSLHGVAGSLLGILAGFLLLLIPYLVGGMMAGDVKFLMAIGALAGWKGALGALLAALIFYPLMAIIAVVRERKVGLTWRRFRRVFWTFLGLIHPAFRVYALRHELEDEPHLTSVRTPFGVALAVGVLLIQYTQILDLLIGGIGKQ